MNNLKYLSALISLILCFSLAGCRRVESDLSADDTNDEITTQTDTSSNEVTTAYAEEETVTLYMVGDVLLHERVVESGHKSDNTYNFDHLFKNVKEDIEKADIAIVNQEVILGGAPLGISGYPNFNGPFEVGDALADAGFDVVLHATNHALDRGRDGIMNCIGFWKTEHPSVSFLGINETAEEQNTVLVKTVNGIKIAILNYTYGTNGIPLPDGMPYAVNLLDEDTLTQDLQKAESLADFTVVCPHWGTEYRHEADDSQHYWANLMIENGADLIIGTHPHVIEPVEVINGVPVYWSLGNYINSTAETGDGIADRMLGAAADVTLVKDGGKVVIKDYGAIPLVCHVADGTEMTTYRLSDYTDALAAENGIVSSDSSFSLDYMKTLANRIFGDLCMN